MDTVYEATHPRVDFFNSAWKTQASIWQSETALAYHDLLKPHQTINGKSYKKVLFYLNKELKQKIPATMKDTTNFLHFTEIYTGLVALFMFLNGTICFAPSEAQFIFFAEIEK